MVLRAVEQGCAALSSIQRGLELGILVVAFSSTVGWGAGIRWSNSLVHKEREFKSLGRLVVVSDPHAEVGKVWGKWVIVGGDGISVVVELRDIPVEGG